MSEKLTPVAGKWALVHGGSYGGMLSPSTGQITKVMKSTFALDTGHGWTRERVPHVELLALFDSKDEVARAEQSIAGIRGERNRRIEAANKAAAEQVAKFLTHSRDHHDA